MSATGSYDLSSDHTPVIAMLSTSILLRQPQARLHNSKTNWELFRTILDSNIQLTAKLETQEDTEMEYRQFIDLLQEAAKRATPIFTLHNPKVNIPLQVKQLTAAKRRVRSTWQSLSIPEDLMDCFQDLGDILDDVGLLSAASTVEAEVPASSSTCTDSLFDLLNPDDLGEVNIYDCLPHVLPPRLHLTGKNDQQKCYVLRGFE